MMDSSSFAWMNKVERCGRARSRLRTCRFVRCCRRKARTSASATQPPFDILANEALHQLGPMGLHEAADRFLDHLVPAVEPALFDQGVDLAIQALGDSRFDGFHGNGPRV